MRYDGLIAPNAAVAVGERARCGNFGTPVCATWFRKVGEKPSVAGSKSIVIVLLSTNCVQPNRSASTELSLSIQVLLIARICGVRFSR